MEAPDPSTGLQVPLFHPRTDRWAAHFAWSADGYTLQGLTSVGRATILTLALNTPLRLAARRYWWELGLLP
jgi:hypothetical protein